MRRLHARALLNFKIIRLDIAQSYFTGTVEFRSDAYRANIQGQRRDKVLRLPFHLPGFGGGGPARMLVRVSGPRGLYVEDWLTYGGKSEWLEIDSDAITYYLADHQDELDTIEVDYSGVK